MSGAEVTTCKGLNGAINWAVGAARPDVSAAVSLLPSQVNERLPQSISDLNAAARQARGFVVQVRIRPRPPEDWRCFCFVDSSCGTSGQQRNQHGWLSGVTTAGLNGGEEAPLSLIQRHRRKQQRKASSPLLGDTYAASSAARELAWLRCLLISTKYSSWDVVEQEWRTDCLDEDEPRL